MLKQLALPAGTRKIDLKLIKTLLPACFGTLVEYYDYALYGFCASLLAAEFFPTDTPAIALCKTFGIFLSGSLSKPLGALIFGYIGDRFGRQLSLKISMLGIMLPTTLIGCLPGYRDIGWLAPFLLLICRLLQGMFTVGESDGVRIFIYESLGKHQPCLANSLSGLACMLGIYLASFAGFLCMRFEAQPEVWRFPFLFGGLLGLTVFLLRRSLVETPDFIAHRAQRSARPQQAREKFFQVILNNRRGIVASVLLCGSVGGIYHFYLVFWGHYLSHSLALLSPIEIAFCMAKALFIYTICGPIAGIIADRLGPLKTLEMSLFGLLVSLLVNMLMLYQGRLSLWVFYLSIVPVAFFSSPGFVVLFQQFSVGERYRCLSFGHALGSMIFSGSAPLISLWLWQITRIPIAPLGYLFCLILMGFVAVFLLKAQTIPAQEE